MRVVVNIVIDEVELENDTRQCSEMVFFRYESGQGIMTNFARHLFCEWPPPPDTSHIHLM